MTRTFQSKADQAMAEFEENLFKQGQLFTGFDNLAKASDPSLCERRELALGGLDDKELASEISMLNSYLREERQMYERDTHFYNILEAAKQRIQHLSGRLKRAEGKVVEQPVESFAACTQESPMATKFDVICQEKGNVNQFKEGDVRNRQRDGKTDRPSAPPPAPTPDVPKEFTDRYPKIIELHGRIGVIGSHTSSVLMSAAFGRKHGDVRRELMAKGDTVTRILTQFNRVAWAVGILDGDSMEDMVVKILRKYPDISSNLVLGCIEVGNPFWKTMSQKELEELLGKFHELVAIVDPKKEL